MESDDLAQIVWKYHLESGGKKKHQWGCNERNQFETVSNAGKN